MGPRIQKPVSALIEAGPYSILAKRIAGGRKRIAGALDNKQRMLHLVGEHKPTDDEANSQEEDHYDSLGPTKEQGQHAQHGTEWWRSVQRPVP